MGLKIEREVLDDSNLPPTESRICPIHGEVEFVRIDGTDIYVCPFPREKHGVKGHLKDDLPGTPPFRRV